MGLFQLAVLCLLCLHCTSVADLVGVSAQGQAASEEIKYKKLSKLDLVASKSLRVEARNALEIYGPVFSQISSELIDDSSFLNSGAEKAEEEVFLFSTGLFEKAQSALQRSSLAFIDSRVEKSVPFGADTDSSKEPSSRDGASEEATDQGRGLTVPSNSESADALAVEWLRISALLGHREGVALFARLMLLQGLGSYLNAEDVVPRSLERSWALRLLTKSAELGSPLAQTYLGLLYSAGIGPISDAAAAGDVDVSDMFEDGVSMADSWSVPQSLLYLYMGANGGDAMAQLSLGWRHALGIGVPKSCQAAILYYDTPAYLMVDKAREPGSILRHSFGAPNKDRISSSDAVKSVRWQKPQENTYGLGSVFDFKSFYNLYSKFMSKSSTPQYELDMLQYYEYRASAGNAAAQTAMGEVFLSGSSGMPQDFQRAAEYFESAVSGNDREATAQLGHLYANGLGVEQSNTTAMTYFQQAANAGSAHGMYGLGYMYLSGFTEDYLGDEEEGTSTGEESTTAGDPPNIDIDKAITYLSKASDRGHVEAIFLLGVMYLNGWNANSKRIIAKVKDVIHDKANITLSKESDTHKAYHYLQVAAYAGHPIAMYNTAMMRLLGMGTPSSCQGALELLKPLAERLSPETKLLEYSYEAVSSGVDTAALGYLIAGYSGIEVAQTNAAYLLQHGSDIDFDLISFEDGQEVRSPQVDGQRQAIKFHKYAAEQGNMASLLAIGDIYFYGYGVNISREQAGEAYRRAAEIATSRKADTHASILAGGGPKNNGNEGDDFDLTPPVATAFAYFNLGVMHQLGIGLPQDLHLAKRFYDLSKGSHSTASGPCTIALFGLRMHMAVEHIAPSVKKYALLILDYIPDASPLIKQVFPSLEGSSATMITFLLFFPFGLLVLMQMFMRGR